MNCQSKTGLYGAVTVGEKGQIVIPSGLRKAFHIKPGDKVIVFTKHHKICIIPADELNKFLNRTTQILEKFKKISNA